MKIVIYTTILCFLTITATAQDNIAKHPIDKAQAECLRTHNGTMPRAKCYSVAMEAWEKDVSKTYAELLLKVNTSDKKLLIDLQTAWGKYRDEGFDFIAKLYAQKKGTGYISVRIIERMEIVKNRALQLESWLDTVKNSTAINFIKQEKPMSISTR